MGARLKTILVVVSVILLIGLVFLLTFDGSSSQHDEKIVESLQANALPFVQDHNISFYFNQNWCKGLKYGSRSVVEVTNDRNGKCLDSSVVFSETDRSLFDELSAKLGVIPGKKIVEIDIEHPLNYKPEHASFPESAIGLAFHVDCSFCRTRYVYWPSYKILPPDIEREIRYIPINKDWYRVEQDWN